MSNQKRAAVTLIAALFLGCSSDSKPAAECSVYQAGCANPCDGRGTKLIAKASATTHNDGHLLLALRLHTAWSDQPANAEALAAFQRKIAAETKETLGQCGLTIAWAESRLLAVPASTLTVTAIKGDSQAGFAPKGADNRAFHYALAESLPKRTKHFLELGRSGLAPNAITINFVDNIHVFHGGKPARVGGFAFIPTTYHQANDFPARNAVLISASYPQCGALPKQPAPRVVSHELGHMLLDDGNHDTDPTNLMSRLSGPTLRPEQCARIRENLNRLYGEHPLIDPGPPSARAAPEP